MAQRKLSAKQIAAGFGGKAAQRANRKPRKSRPMAKSSKKSGSRRSVRGLLSSQRLKRDGIAAATGAAAPYVEQALPGYGAPATFLAAGIAAKNETLETIGAVGLGAQIARQLTAGTPAAPRSQPNVI